MNRRRLIASLPLAAAGLLRPTAARSSPSAPGSPAGGRTPRRATGTGPMQTGVELRVLGTAQDAGVPQVNCFKDHCARVRAGNAVAPRVACLGLVDSVAGRRFLIDATPDFPAQVGALIATPGGSPPANVAGQTVPLHQHLHGIWLTHAHIGHYTGLVHLGKEAAAPQRLPLWASQSMGDYLRANAPWEALFRAGNVDYRVATPDARVQLTERLAVTPFSVVHRPEYSDTLGYLIHGPERTAMYVPDADVWDGWDTPFEELLGRSDLALIDGSFWSHEELGHRVQADIPHPPVSETIERLGGMPDRPEIWFTHLNHTNPLWDPDAAQYAALRAGFGVATTGQRFEL